MPSCLSQWDLASTISPQTMTCGRKYVRVVSTPVEKGGSCPALHSGKLRIRTYLGGLVHFSDVAIACARKVISESKPFRGHVIHDLPHTHAVVRKYNSWRNGDTEQVTKHLDADEEDVEYHKQHDFLVKHGRAAHIIQETFRCFSFRKDLTTGEARSTSLLFASSNTLCVGRTASCVAITPTGESITAKAIRNKRLSAARAKIRQLLQHTQLSCHP